MAGNKNLHVAKKDKQDEFYTQLSDIENELRHYKKHFKDKVIFCNCDDPYESNFFKYFAMNFNALGLKKLIATCYAGSPVAERQLSLFEEENEQQTKTGVPHKIVITEVTDQNGDGATNLADVEWLLRNDKNVLTRLNGDGDFRSTECVSLLKESDIVVTNPPFSLFREYVAQLIDNEKRFLIIGNQNAITYKEIFKLIKENKIWLGFKSGHTLFEVPDSYTIPDFYDKNDRGKLRSNGYIIDGNGKLWRNLGNICWFTNLDHDKRHEEIDLYKHYTPEEYPHYDNYDAINCDLVANIPMDYDGVMGVPISFLDKYCPEQFEILGATQRECHDEVPDTRKYDDYWEVKPNGEKTGSSGGKTNENGNLLKNDGRHNYFENVEGRQIQSTYQRIFIRKKSKLE